jgi:DNA-binding XRE family transcriptional regulator
MNKEYLEKGLIERYGNFLSRNDIAKELGVTTQTIRRAEKANKLIPTRLSARCIRYSVTAVVSYIVDCMDI